MAGIGQIAIFAGHGAPQPAPFSERRLSVESFERLKQLISEIDEDIRKAEGGNKAAGTRIRKVMQDIKNTAQEVRVKVLDLRQD